MGSAERCWLVISALPLQRSMRSILILESFSARSLATQAIRGFGLSVLATAEMVATPASSTSRLGLMEKRTDYSSQRPPCPNQLHYFCLEVACCRCGGAAG